MAQLKAVLRHDEPDESVLHDQLAELSQLLGAEAARREDRGTTRQRADAEPPRCAELQRAVLREWPMHTRVRKGCSRGDGPRQTASVETRRNSSVNAAHI